MHAGSTERLLILGGAGMTGLQVAREAARELVRRLGFETGCYSRCWEISTAHLSGCAADYLGQLADLPMPSGLPFEAFRLRHSGALGVKLFATPWTDEHLQRVEEISAAQSLQDCRERGVPESLLEVIQLAALASVLSLERISVADLDHARAEAVAARATARLGLRVEAIEDVRAALRESDVCVTCTPARRAFVMAADVRPGTFIAAVGADSEGKQEIDPLLIASATLVVDVLEQCAEIGELQHALAAGLMTRSQVHAELADVVAGRRPGRTRQDEITIFDSTGTALQDVAAAVAVYETARASGRGTEIALDD